MIRITIETDETLDGPTTAAELAWEWAQDLSANWLYAGTVTDLNGDVIRYEVEPDAKSGEFAIIVKAMAR